MSKTEETVSTPKGADAFIAARASVASRESQDQPDEEPPTDADDTPPPEPPAEDPAKVADPPEEPTEPQDDALLTTEEVSKLSAKERSLYEKAQKNYTLKTQKLAADRKAMEEWNPLIEAFKADPEKAIRQLAEQRGLKIAEKEAEKAINDDLPEELKFLEPILSARDQKIEAKIRGELAPVKDAMDRMTSEAIAAETESTMAQFDSKFPGWKKHEPRMLELGKQFIPAEGSMTYFQYMKNLYTLATAEISEAEKTKKVVEKINKAHASADPTMESGISDSRVEHALPPPDQRDMKAAYEAAKRGVRWVK